MIVCSARHPTDGLQRQRMHRINSEHANAGRRALAACSLDLQNLGENVREVLINLGHLCDVENVDYVEVIKRAILSWQVERVDPNSVAAGPNVEVIIGTEGLPPQPERAKHPARRQNARSLANAHTKGGAHESDARCGSVAEETQKRSHHSPDCCAGMLRVDEGLRCHVERFEDIDALGPNGSGDAHDRGQPL